MATPLLRLDGGAFLIMHSEIDEPEVPSGIAIIGSDDATDEFLCFILMSAAFEMDPEFGTG
jgi:hypothetical protein